MMVATKLAARADCSQAGETHMQNQTKILVAVAAIVAVALIVGPESNEDTDDRMANEPLDIAHRRCADLISRITQARPSDVPREKNFAAKESNFYFGFGTFDGTALQGEPAKISASCGGQLTPSVRVDWFSIGESWHDREDWPSGWKQSLVEIQ